MEIEKVAVRFVCTACSSPVEVEMDFLYDRTVLYRGPWVLITETEMTSGEATCPKCLTFNRNAWTTYHEDKSWISRQKWK